MIPNDIDQSPRQTLPVVQGSRPGDWLIRIRETVLNRLSGVKPGLVVNDAATDESVPPVDDLAVRLKTALTNLQATAMDADGTHVDYDTLRHNPAYAAYRQTYLAALRRFDPGSLSLPAARAFWINLYNALVIDAVLAFDIQTSVVEGPIGLLTFFRRAAYNVGGRRVSLEDMEHGILRGNRGNPYVPGVHFAADDPRLSWALPGDARIHFALNCGGRSCPPIRAYTSKLLEQQLDLAARGYLDATVTISPESNEVVLPHILRWFAADFGGKMGVLQFLKAYLPDDDRRRFLLSENNLQTTYSPYDWQLNTL